MPVLPHLSIFARVIDGPLDEGSLALQCRVECGHNRIFSPNLLLKKSCSLKMGKKKSKKGGATTSSALPPPPPLSVAPAGRSHYAPLLMSNLKLSKTFDDRGVDKSYLIDCIGQTDSQQDILIASQSCGVFEGGDVVMGEKIKGLSILDSRRKSLRAV